MFEWLKTFVNIQICGIDNSGSGGPAEPNVSPASATRRVEGEGTFTRPDSSGEGKYFN